MAESALAGVPPSTAAGSASTIFRLYEPAKMVLKSVGCNKH